MRAQHAGMTLPIRLTLASLFSLLAWNVAACAADSDTGNRSTDDPLATAADGGCDPAPPNDAGTDAGGVCRGTPFQQALVVPLPSTYTVAGYTFGYREFDFATQQDPRRILHHAHDDFVNGNLQIQQEEQIYHPEERILSVAGYQRISKITRAGQPSEYRVRQSSDANLMDYTYNLPTLGPTSVMTTVDRWNTPGTGRTEYYLVRNGAEIYEKEGYKTVWSMAANLTGSGTSGWEGLAATSEESTGGLVLFLGGKLNTGGYGIFEQRWPNSLPSSAGTATLVVPNTNDIPFGVSDDGCELYASRKNGAALEVVIYRR
ncbi:hypothetical protein LZC95_47635 [Pendulispora brunnea]|uniref:Uncharacterized protein n=1 Tax=Pendulispora brunnea TaxID=2905690 RepID=A0ABZ2KB50_9BACT